MTVTTETRLSVLDRNSRNVAQHFGASLISVVLAKNAKTVFCCHGHKYFGPHQIENEFLRKDRDILVKPFTIIFKEILGIILPFKKGNEKDISPLAYPQISLKSIRENNKK